MYSPMGIAKQRFFLSFLIESSSCLIASDEAQKVNREILIFQKFLYHPIFKCRGWATWTVMCSIRKVFFLFIGEKKSLRANLLVNLALSLSYL